MTKKNKKKIRVRQSDEYETYQIGTCENCGRDNVKVRRVESFGMAKESRGFYNLCFDCVGPKVFWKKGGRRMESPTNIIRAPEGLIEFVRSSGEKA